MKNLLALALLLFSSACIGPKVRQSTLVPAVVMAWQGVRADIERGIEDAMEDGDLKNRYQLDAAITQIDEALAQGAPQVLIRLIFWPELEPYAYRGIQDRVDDGELSQMIADSSMRQRIINFSDALKELRISRVFLPPSNTTEHWLPNGGGRVTDQAAIAVATTH